MASAVSPQRYDQYLRQHENWNFAVNLLDLSFFSLARSFIYDSTVLSLYASYLTDSALLIGLIPAIQNVGYFLPQLLIARHTEQLERMKPLIMKVSVMERLPYLFVALGIRFRPNAPPWLSFVILACSLALATSSGGLGSPAWKSMLAKVVPVGRRGRLFGLSDALGGFLGIGGAALSGWILTRYHYPTSFGLCFGLCFLFQLCSYACLSLNREPPKAPSKETLSPRDYWRRLPGLLRENANFSRYLVGRALVTFGAMGTTFYIVYARTAFDLGDGFAARLTMAAFIIQVLSTPLLGWLADRRGNKWVMELGILLDASAVVLIFLAPSSLWLYGVFILANAALAGRRISTLSITMEFSNQEDLPTFTALAGTVLAIPVFLAPVVGGWLADVAGYRALFVAALGFTTLGWVSVHWGLRDPRHESG